MGGLYWISFQAEMGKTEHVDRSYSHTYIYGYLLLMYATNYFSPSISCFLWLTDWLTSYKDIIHICILYYAINNREYPTRGMNTEYVNRTLNQLKTNIRIWAVFNEHKKSTEHFIRIGAKVYGQCKTAWYGVDSIQFVSALEHATNWCHKRTFKKWHFVGHLFFPCIFLFLSHTHTLPLRILWQCVLVSSSLC